MASASNKVRTVVEVGGGKVAEAGEVGEGGGGGGGK